MIIACPECSGKLSSAAPTCPHCGYVQKSAAPAPAPTPAAPPPPAAPELILPSSSALKGAARRILKEWIHSGIWRLLFGAVIIIVTLGLLVLALLLANRMNNDASRPERVNRAPGAGPEATAWA